MSWLANIFSFRSFRSRLIVFLWVLLFPVLGGIFYYVSRNNTEYTEETINLYLELGASVFDFTRLQHTETLSAITTSLTWDFGFRTAYAAQDPATLFDAAVNVLERSKNSTDMLMIVDLDYNVLIDTETQGFTTLEGGWRQLLEAADASDDGMADMIVTIAGEPFQLIALPLYLPRQVAWTIDVFALDADFVDVVKDTIVSDVSIVRLQRGQQLEVISSTLAPDWQTALTRQLRLDATDYDQLQRINFNDEEFTTLLRRLYGDANDDLQITAVIQRSYDENNANVVQFRRLLIQFYLLVFALSLLAVLVLARSITKPLVNLAHVVRRIEAGDYSRVVSVTSRDEIGELATSVNSMARGLAEKEKVRDLLGKVVSHQIAEQLLNNPVELGGEERIVTILFSDIRGFTSFCEGLPPQQVLQELNKVLSLISNIIEANAGVVDKYNGDAVMALFGAPIQNANDASNAMAAILQIIAAMATLGTALRACVGVNTGLVVAGNLGSSNRLNYSVIGDTVNLAARLEGLTRLYNVSNIVSEASMQSAPDYLYRELDKVCVAGKSQPVRIFELLGKAENAVSGLQQGVQQGLPQGLQQEMDWYAEALAAYRAQAWDVATSKFTLLQDKCDNRALMQLFLDRIARFRSKPPAADWDGVYIFDSK